MFTSIAAMHLQVWARLLTLTHRGPTLRRLADSSYFSLLTFDDSEPMLPKFAHGRVRLDLSFTSEGASTAEFPEGRCFVRRDLERIRECVCISMTTSSCEGAVRLDDELPEEIIG